MQDQRRKDKERTQRGSESKKAARQRKRNMEKDREMREENERVERVKGRWWKCGSVSRNRCREGFRRRQYFNRRQIYRPPGRPTIRNGRCARYVPLREVISCLSRPPGLSVWSTTPFCLLSVVCHHARISSSRCSSSHFNDRFSISQFLHVFRLDLLILISA